jgi:hypothetical protein
MPDEIVRVYRILIYEGDREWVENICLGGRQVKGTWHPDPSRKSSRRIIEAVVGEFPHRIEEPTNA